MRCSFLGLSAFAFSCLVFVALITLPSTAQTGRSTAKSTELLVSDCTTPEAALEWFKEMSPHMLRVCRREMLDGRGAYPPQIGSGYEAFWLRDYAYILEGAAKEIPRRDLLDAVNIFLDAQREDGACVDCVKFDGTPIYMPGYGTMGENPVADGSQFMVAVVFLTWQATADHSLLDEKILAALTKAMDAVPRSENGLVFIDPDTEWDRCPYGFTDSVRKQGNVLFSSLLYFEASLRMAKLTDAAGKRDQSVHFTRKANEIKESINRVFWDENTGLYMAATKKCHQPDIWGSAFAVYLNVCDSTKRLKIANYFAENYESLVQSGQVRHLPKDVFWEDATSGQGSYQNGAYWGTPTGWFVYTLAQVDEKLADQTIIDLVHFYQKHGAPEWIQRDRIALTGYMSSVTLPIPAIERMLKERKSGNR